MRTRLFAGIISALLLTGAFAFAEPAAKLPHFEVPGMQALKRMPARQAPPARPMDVVDKNDSYLVGGERIHLFRAPSEFAVQFTPRTDLGSAIAKLQTQRSVSDFKEVGRFGPSNVLIGGLPEGSSNLRANADFVSALGSQQGVQRVYPVYVAEDGNRMIATDIVTVCVRPGTDIDAFERKVQRIAGSGLVIEKLPRSDIEGYNIQLQNWDSQDALDASLEISQWSEVAWAEPDFIRQIDFHFTPNDPMYGDEQVLHNTGQDGAVSDADIDAPEAWNTTTGSSSVVIAIIDEGVDVAHADLNCDTVNDYDFYNNDNDPSPSGTEGHGTGSAGVAAAINNNNYRISGSAGGCTILSIKVAETYFASSTVLGNAITYAADHADILSNSWGGGSASSSINTAIDYAVTSGRGGLGSPVFVSSGNGASTWYYGGGRSRWKFSDIGLASGSYYFGFSYETDAALTAGENCARVDNVCLLGSDEYTPYFQEDFEGATFPPTGWGTQGDANWYNDTTNHLTGTGGAKSPRSGAIGGNQYSMLVTPLTAVSANDTMAFAYSCASRSGDVLAWYVFNSDGSFNTGYYVSQGGYYTPTTAVAYPASYANSIAVGASTDCDYRSDYSEYGSALDFVAPSNGGWHDVISLDPTGSVGWTSTDWKPQFGGTSSACPTAAGVAALMLSVNSSLTAAEIRTLMRQSCDQIGGVTYSGGFNTYYGYGRINANLAVQNAAPGTPTPSPTPSDTPTATPSDTPSPTPSDTPTPTPSDTPSPTPSDTPTPTPSDTPSPTPSATPTPSPTPTPSACGSELFISEYVEGTGNNHGLEIYNPTGSAIDLSTYSIRLYLNGSSTVSESTTLSGGPIAAGGTYVVTYHQADTALKNLADQTWNKLTFDGNDAIELVNGSTVIDSIGQVGVNPGTEWLNNGVGTADETLRRWATITDGDTNSGDAFDPSAEWVSFPVDTFSGVGSHTVDCVTPTPTDTPTATPSDTPSPTPSDTPSPTPSDTPSPTPSDTPTPTPSDTPSPTPSDTPSPTPSDTPSPTPSDTPSPTPSDTPTPTPSDTPTPTLTPTPTPAQLAGDADGNGEVNLFELNAVVLGYRGVGPVPPSADIDPTDGVISISELNAAVLAYRGSI
ncbi:S8 family serine peptidase [bacterium]|nr:S8 family serine peptidase [bacterium]